MVIAARINLQKYFEVSEIGHTLWKGEAGEWEGMDA